MAVEDRVHGRGCEPELPADRMRSAAAARPLGQHQPLQQLRAAPRRVVRPARAVLESFAGAEAADPLRGGLPRATAADGGGRDRRAGADCHYKPLSLAKAESSITMN